MESTLWHYILGEAQHGPVESVHMAQLVANGSITPDSMVWCDGMTGWKAAKETALASIFASMQTAVMPVASGATNPGDKDKNLKQNHQPTGMQGKCKLGLALLGLRISTILYYLMMLGCLVWASVPSDDREFDHTLLAWVLFICLVPFVVFLEILIFHLKRRKYWAWVAGLVVAALYAPSLFLPLGVMIFVGLLSCGTREEFETHGKKTL